MRPGPAWLALLPLLLAGCESEPLDGEEEAPAPECPAPEGFSTSVDPQEVGQVDALVVDLSGDPLPSDPLVQVCGLDLCINGLTDAAGVVSVPVGQEMMLPAFKYGDGLTSGKLALVLSPPTTMVDLGTVRTPVLPETGAPISPGKTASSGGVDLVLEEGATVQFDRFVYTTPDEQAFRAAELPADLAPPGLDQGLGLELYFALAPLETEFCPEAKLVVPNVAGWRAGTEVEFYVQGLEVDERHAPYAGFAKVAEGSVSSDEVSLSTESGGLPVLSFVGIRRKP